MGCLSLVLFFRDSYERGKKLLTLGLWKKNLDETLSFVKPEHYDDVEMFPDRLVQSDDLVYGLIDALKSGPGDILRKAGDWELELSKWRGQGVIGFILLLKWRIKFEPEIPA
ncbi:hypothetical protein PVAR5_1509 [Paecilomyces variotii No. 5]|uniref:Uncharacterized protein n=1 Tax=Byssochlamys spectabilis (strain No. 5 / NBRC 109023) TaxID=1356009 RepID=V5FWC0_BYSSN|nr:hypothetical protein PVAR5_1509 [Paecilomyces variotii No. 5]